MGSGRICPKLRGNAKGRAFVIGAQEAIQDPTVVTGIFLINKLYTNVLFDTGDDKSYITPEYRKFLNHPSSKLREAYRVEMDNNQFGSTQ